MPTLLLIALLSLGGCSTMTTTLEPPDTQYDTRIVEATTGRVLNVAALARQVSAADVVVVGEYHGHHGSHLLQSRLQAALYRQRPDQVLTMEQFELDHQAELDGYLSGQIGETELIEDTAAWDNYRASYRPLVEFARTRAIPVIAANAPADIVRCVGRKGADYLDTLAEERRSRLPRDPFIDTPAYQAKFVAAIAGSHGAGDPTMSKRMQNTYRAQLLRDNTMAVSILEAREAFPDHQILHVTGTFHSEERLGTVAVLEQRAPELSVAVISPVFWPDNQTAPAVEEYRQRGDFLYFIQPLPVEFRDPERERAAMTARFSQSGSTRCD
ncbi:ChaN family lipoprotein [Marinobacter sp. M216]|uniref:ChaN family lipoprotein n=1 Tax=Marinobacter albus TaxID=3030833 RepID=A0ABT7H7U6_9GAMM|nr:ChaN family lipoprotein [Marinobacter sp. M216]MDK9556433.1 ChaN family lipoprotein [Marinobacter sp. M216]